MSSGVLISEQLFPQTNESTDTQVRKVASPRRILVTGASGFVGRHLMRRLLDEHYLPFGIDQNAHTEPLVTRLSVEEFFRDYRALCSWDTVIHLAANIVNVDQRMKMGVRAFGDLVLDYHMCYWLQEVRPRRVIFMSSCAVDGLRDPYSMVKRNLEAMAAALIRQGIECIILRPFSGYGGDQSAEYPFPAILDRAMKKEDPLTVWGGEQVRDWLYIADLVDAIIHAVEGKFPVGIPIDIGTGFGTDFLCLARKIAAAVGYSPQIVGDDTKEVSSQLRIAMPNLAASYGWKARFPLELGIKKALSVRRHL